MADWIRWSVALPEPEGDDWPSGDENAAWSVDEEDEEDDEESEDEEEPPNRPPNAIVRRVVKWFGNRLAEEMCRR